jgi:hypothetical protein
MIISHGRLGGEIPEWAEMPKLPKVEKQTYRGFTRMNADKKMRSGIVKEAGFSYVPLSMGHPAAASFHEVSARTRDRLRCASGIESAHAHEHEISMALKSSGADPSPSPLQTSKADRPILARLRVAYSVKPSDNLHSIPKLL